MEAFLDSVAVWSWLAYLIVFLAVLIESAGAPIPGLTLVLAAGALAGQNRLDFWLVFLASIAGGVAGGAVGYAIGKYGGHQLLYRYGRYIRLTSARLESGERLFQQHGNKAIIAGRYLPIFCFLAAVLSGIARLPYRRFFLLNFLGILIWSTTQLTLAFIFGRSLDMLVKATSNIGLAMTVAALVIAGWIYLKQRRLVAQKRARSLPETVPVRSDN
ncbi:MAG TPA: DedA family protein [Chloroflexia bacterium]|nr:DedA family protein [Chloroflexia bacterium]